ncbi:hypothetical protein Nepgr_002028 [Nepenthes gracilis]|uniref:Uncharacterized protein n=1 Tax=Nepenthes gracilis TaxID=150966 RepID=A0AAD3P946_NEPGR|nr:hypothetical protein Nepgr_002028 [Nepenthes gracilis]
MADFFYLPKHYSHSGRPFSLLPPLTSSPSSPRIRRSLVLYLFDPEYLAWHALLDAGQPHVYALCNFASLSVGWHLYVLGGSLFDTRSFPMDRPSPSSVAFRFDLLFRLEPDFPMLMPRGPFACTAISDSNQIL